MILKIEMRYYSVPDPQAGPLVQNYSNRFVIIDEVEQVRYGDVFPITDIPLPVADETGVVTEVEKFLNSGAERFASEHSVTLHVNLIEFVHRGKRRVIAAAGNVYLCNDQGDTVEIIRSYEY